MSDAKIVCPRCGTANEPRARFCWSCGASLAAPSSPAGSPPSNRDGAGAPDPWGEPSPWAPPEVTGAAPGSGQGGPETTPPRPFASAAGSRTGRSPVGPLGGVNPRSIILIGLVLLLLSCLWFIVALVSKLTIWFSLLCLLPLGVIAVIIGVVLLLGQSTRRRF